MLPLLFRRDGFAGASDRQNTVSTAFVVQTFREITAEIVVAYRFAGSQFAIAKHQEGLSLLETIDLPRQGFEEGGRPDDRIGDAGVDQCGLKSQLCALEGQQRLLDADRRQQHHMRDAGRLRSLKRRHMRRVIHGPCVPGSAGSRRQTGHQGVEMLAAKAVSRQRTGVGHIAKSQAGAFEQLCAVVRRQSAAHTRAGAHETHHVMTSLNQRAHGRASDRACGAEDENTAGVGGGVRSAHT